MKQRLKSGLGAAGLVLALGALVSTFPLTWASDQDMAPSIRQGELLVLGPVGELERGDVVLVEDPAEPGRLVLRRVLAMDRGEVKLHSGLFHVERQELRQAEMGRDEQLVTLSEANRYLIARADRRLAEPSRSWTLEQGQLFLAADLREGPMDSRHWGPVPDSAVRKKLLWRVEGEDAWRQPMAASAQDGPWIPVSKQKPPEGT